jgi:hypothetical protein
MAAPNLRGRCVHLIFSRWTSVYLNGVIMDNAAISLSLFLWIRQDSLCLSFGRVVGFVYWFWFQEWCRCLCLWVDMGESMGCSFGCTEPPREVRLYQFKWWFLFFHRYYHLHPHSNSLYFIVFQWKPQTGFADRDIKDNFAGFDWQLSLMWLVL